MPADFAPRTEFHIFSAGTSNAIIGSFCALLNGAALLPFDVNREGFGVLSRWLAQEKITILPIAAPLFRNLCEVLTEAERFPDLRLLRLSSETVCKTDVDLYKRYFSAYSLLVNGLNSSETHLLAEYFIERDSKVPGDDVPVGYAARDKEIVLLDEQGDPVGYNEIGEIVVRSKYLSPGYWRDPELTTAKFKTDPEHGDQRIYHTGDLGLMLADGCLIHKGRKDFRVKIRGYGVEIGEVEKTLREQVGIQDAVVVAKVRDSGEARLVAYLTSPAAPSTREMRRLLQTKLPEYMVPSTFVFLDALPLTVNGKIDRRALPDPDGRRPELDTPFVTPRTDIENTVALIFSQCIGIEPVGIEDNLFELGGDSLTLGRVMTRLTASFEREIPMANLFASPSVAGIARLLEATARSSAPANETALCSGSSKPPRELSFSQQRLWFLDQLHPGDPAYNLLSAFQIAGKLNISALEQSLNEIIARHEVLRTVFESVDGRPNLKVLANLTTSLNVVDLGERKSVLEDEAVLRRYCAALARQPFDLSRGPMLRVSLLRRSDDDHVLLFAVHHIVFDAWSMGVLWGELADCYEAFCQGKEVSLPKLAIQYADYASWQRDRLQNHLMQKQSEYWRRQLDGTTPIHLLTDRPRPPVQSSRGAKQCFTLSLDLSAKLKRLSRDRGATLFMTLLAAFQTLLHRYTSQDDITIGCPVAGRNRAEVENLIGFFLNILVFRVDTSGEPSFLELLNRVRLVCLAAYAHQDLPFEKLVEELHPERQLNRSPIVDVAFAFQNTPHVAPVLSGTSVSPLDLDSGISRFDLQLFLEESSGQLRGNFSYNTDLFDERTIVRMTEHFLNLLESIIAGPEQPIDRLALLSAPERQQLLEKWNDTQRDFPSDKYVHELFEAQAKRCPDAVALIFEHQQLTYRELNQKANQLAHYLRQRGVQAESLVAVCMERSLEMAIAILAVLKAGGAYVPMDPDSPTDRLKFMLQDIPTPLILTQERFNTFLSGFTDQRICLDNAWEELSQQSEENLQNQVDGHNVAYMIYTSGSTGRPKGVLNVHGGLRNRLQWMQEAYRLTPADRVLQKTPFTFDVSVWELLWPLISGACLVMARPGGHRDSAYLVELIKSQCITALHFVPSMLGVFLQESGAESCTTLRQVFCSGEALSYELQQRFFARSGAALHNLYGPTEASIDVTAWQCRTESDRPVVPIGRPIANTRIYILDRYLEPVPIGVAGELHIGGVGLSRGYLNQPALTAEKFIYHFFSAAPAKRLYKSGDLARYFPDGNIEFLGRIDTQVKIRGYRIELGEVEAVLGQHRAVQTSVVAVREDEPGDKRLVGYVVAQPQGSFDAAEVKNYLKQKLPEYMIPSALVLLDDLPLTPSGKVDRRALPAPDQSRRELENVYQAPRTATEETLAAIWREVLKLVKVGVYDNFFDLGGHSLLATQIVSRIRSAFSIEFPLRTLFESPTVAEMAAIVMQKQGKQASDEALAQILREMDGMTEDEVQKQLARESANTAAEERHE